MDERRLRVNQRSHLRHLAFSATGPYKQIIGLIIMAGEKTTFFQLQYAEAKRHRRKSLKIPYGRTGVTVLISIEVYSGLDSAFLTAIDAAGERCDLPRTFRYFHLYSDGSRRAFERKG